METLTKEQEIDLIAGRIIDEHRKHPTLEWHKIAASKIRDQWMTHWQDDAQDTIDKQSFIIHDLNEAVTDRDKRILELEKEKWVSVEIPPNEGQYVLVYGRGGRMLTALFQKGRFMAYEMITEMLEECDYIDFWQPLPDKPKDK